MRLFRKSLPQRDKASSFKISIRDHIVNIDKKIKNLEDDDIGVLLDTFIDDKSDVEESGIINEKYNRILAILNENLNFKERKILFTIAEAGSVAEAARWMGISRQAVHEKYKRLQKRIITIYNTYNYED